MPKRKKRQFWCAIALLVVGAVGWLMLGGKSTGAAEKYKAELRAKGEKITFAELGFPKPPEDGTSLSKLTNATSGLRLHGLEVGRLTSPSFLGPGRQLVVWRARAWPLEYYTNQLAWTEASTSLSGFTNELAAIRAAVEQPPRWFLYNPAGHFTNPGTALPYSFVGMRHAVQWLYVDGIAALHAGDLARARQDQHAINQLAEFNREEPTLVAAMLRVAIAGLGLQFTWQALQHTNWTGADLLAMQRDWERVDLLEAVETGWTGARASTEMVFATSRREGIGWITRVLTSRTNVNPLERIKDQAVAVMWNADEDELFALQHHQSSLEAIRSLRTGRSWPPVQISIQSDHDRVSRTIGSATGLNRFHYLLSAMMIPNLSKAVQTSVRHETLRRLTVSALALQRFQLRHQRWPEKLEELVPEFLAAVLADPMSGGQLRYRREATGGFVLYSVGEDGVDNGGDVTPTNNVSKAEPWSGLDFVWPKPAD